MLNDLKLLHAYLGQLIEQEAAGTVVLREVSRETVGRQDTLYVRVDRVPAVEAPSCDHSFRRIASGEYECTRPGCGIITDDLESEQWQ